MTRQDIEHWIQQRDDELLGYHPWDEGADREEPEPTPPFRDAVVATWELDESPHAEPQRAPDWMWDEGTP